MRPNLAETITEANVHQIRLPVYGSPKFDGFRAFIYHGIVMSRSFKAIPNMNIQNKFGKLPHGWDGELIMGDPCAANCFGRTSSAVTTRGAPVDGVKFYVFDDYSMNAAFKYRIANVDRRVRVQHLRLDTFDMIERYEAEQLALGYEGIVLRNPEALYKFGRSTMTDQGMMKVKRFADYEGIVVGVEEMYHNKNEAKTDAQGYMDRGSKKEGMVPAGLCGVLLVEWMGQTLRVSQGFDDATRRVFWTNPPIGKLAKFKCPPGGKPVSEGGTGLRPPYVFLGLRSHLDV